MGYITKFSNKIRAIWWVLDLSLPKSQNTIHVANQSNIAASINSIVTYIQRRTLPLMILLGRPPPDIVKANNKYVGGRNQFIKTKHQSIFGWVEVSGKEQCLLSAVFINNLWMDTKKKEKISFKTRAIFICASTSHPLFFRRDEHIQKEHSSIWVISN